MNRQFLFIIFAIGFIITMIWPGGINSVADSSGYFIRVESSLISITVLPIIGILGMILPRVQMQNLSDEGVGIWPRFGAFMIDMGMLMFIFTPLLTLPFLWIEYKYTGDFTWSFYRTFYRKTDLILWGFFLPLFAAIIYYFYKHAQIGKATVGQFIMGYTIIPTGDNKKEAKYIQRIMGGTLAACVWPITLLKFRKIKDGIFWWDEQSNTRAVRTKP